MIAADILVFDSPFWNALWVLLIVIPVVTLWVLALVDLVWRGDLGGWRKALWLLVILVVPVIGVLVYVVMRPRRAAPMTFEPTQWEMASATEQLRSLAALHEAGKLSDAEFAAAQARLTGEGA